MTNESAPTDKPADPNNALTWPENSPAVSVDVKAGYQRVDFDMPAYNKLLDSMGVGSERKDLHVHLAHPNDMPMASTAGNIPQRTSGVYGDISGSKDIGIHQSKMIMVVAETPADKRPIPFPPPPSPNGTLIHETQHFSQDTRGKLMSKKTRKQRERIAKVLPLIGPEIELITRPEEIGAQVAKAKKFRKHNNIIKTSWLD